MASDETKQTVAGFPVVTDPTVPPDTVEFRQDGHTIGKIVNMRRLVDETDAGAVPGCTTECKQMSDDVAHGVAVLARIQLTKLREECAKLREENERLRVEARREMRGMMEDLGAATQQAEAMMAERNSYYEECASLRADAEAVRAENRTLRELLWSGHGHTGLYGDDGEMQCATCMIDYKRDSASEIERKRIANGQRALMARRQEEGQTDNG